MAESKTRMPKRFYWLKLKEGFFREKIVKLLRKKENGDLLTVLYLQLMLLSLQGEGTIYYEGLEDTICDEIITELDLSITDGEALFYLIDFLTERDYITVLDDGSLRLNEVGELIGSESDSAKRMREKRIRDRKNAQVKAKNTASHCDESVSHCDIGVTQCDAQPEKSYLDDKYTASQCDGSMSQSDKGVTVCDAQRFSEGWDASQCDDDLSLSDEDWFNQNSFMYDIEDKEEDLKNNKSALDKAEKIDTSHCDGSASHCDKSVTPEIEIELEKELEKEQKQEQKQEKEKTKKEKTKKAKAKNQIETEFTENKKIYSDVFETGEIFLDDSENQDEDLWDANASASAFAGDYLVGEDRKIADIHLPKVADIHLPFMDEPVSLDEVREIVKTQHLSYLDPVRVYNTLSAQKWCSRDGRPIANLIGFLRFMNAQEQNKANSQKPPVKPELPEWWVKTQKTIPLSPELLAKIESIQKGSG